MQETISHQDFRQILRALPPASSTKTVPGKFGAAPTRETTVYAPLNSDIYMSGVPSITKTESQKQMLASVSQKLPEYFSYTDYRKSKDINTKNGISPPPNQAACGSCWAFSTATTVSDVHWLSGVNSEDVKLFISPTYAMSQWQDDQEVGQGCNGGNPGALLNMISQDGIGTTNCVDYSWEGGQSQSLPSVGCYESGDHLNLKVDNVHSVGITSSDMKDNSEIDWVRNQVKTHLYDVGPMVGAFAVLSNFTGGDFSATNNIYFDTYDYKSGTWKSQPTFEGGHAVRILGWGVEKNMDINGKKYDVPYWIIGNSWNDPSRGPWNPKSPDLPGTWRHAMYPKSNSNEYGNKTSVFEVPSSVMLSASMCSKLGKLPGSCKYQTAADGESSKSIIGFTVKNAPTLNHKNKTDSMRPDSCAKGETLNCNNALWGTSRPADLKPIDAKSFFEPEQNLFKKGDMKSRSGSHHHSELSQHHHLFWVILLVLAFIAIFIGLGFSIKHMMKK